MKAALRKKASELLQSPHFFQELGRVICNVGLPGEEGLGIGVFFIASSRLLQYPLRLTIQEKTRGTAAYLIRGMASVIGEDSVITVDPSSDSGWSHVKATACNKLLFIPELEKKIGGERYRRFDIRQNNLIRIEGLSDEERDVEEQIMEADQLNESFSCVTRSRFMDGYRARARWFTMKQPPQRNDVPNSHGRVSAGDKLVWLAVQRLLEERAKLPVFFAEWRQLVVDEMCERGHQAPVHIPALLQSWRTMAVLRSFASDAHDQNWIETGFSDFAQTILLCKQLFKEASWFPAPTNVYKRVFSPGSEKSVLHPITGKQITYKHPLPKVKPFRNLLGLNTG